ncbi:hypothetical protein L914_20361 [Phytophthora nicotianae]|uniref:Uncharacterized protein n=2 Tax=Phytophthora nicotianae TaxID=4792 RepID=V9DYZ2_PHYNI|nr:hypothetical protein F443_21204 [Phytophthora nicotianae P1569]ETM32175.1 hypothetical protein L914_20361 [Phytophthora nicotianae]
MTAQWSHAPCHFLAANKLNQLEHKPHLTMSIWLTEISRETSSVVVGCKLYMCDHGTPVQLAAIDSTLCRQQESDSGDRQCGQQTQARHCRHDSRRKIKH